MGEHVGFDVSREATAFCVMDEAGEVIARGKADNLPQLLLIPWEGKAKGHYHEARRPTRRSRLRRQPCSRRRKQPAPIRRAKDGGEMGPYQRDLVLLRRLAIALRRRAAADQVAVAVGVVDPPDRRPVLVLAQRVQREEGLLLRMRPRPRALEQQMMGVCGAPLGVHVLGIGPKRDAGAGMSVMPPNFFRSLPPDANVISEDAYSLQLTQAER